MTQALYIHVSHNSCIPCPSLYLTLTRTCQISITKFLLFQAKFYCPKNSQIWNPVTKVDRTNCKTRDDCHSSFNLLCSRVPQLWISGHRHQPGPPLSSGRYDQRPYRHPPRAHNGARPWKRHTKVGSISFHFLEIESEFADKLLLYTYFSASATTTSFYTGSTTRRCSLRRRPRK